MTGVSKSNKCEIEISIEFDRSLVLGTRIMHAVNDALSIVRRMVKVTAATVNSEKANEKDRPLPDGLLENGSSKAVALLLRE